MIKIVDARLSCMSDRPKKGCQDGNRIGHLPTVQARRMMGREGQREKDLRQQCDLFRQRIEELERKITECGEREELYRSLVDRTHEFIFTMSLDGRFTFINRALETNSDWAREDWLGEHFSRFIHPDDMPMVVERMKRIAGGEVLASNEVRIVMKSGEIREFEYTTSILMRHGEPVGIWGIVLNIAERKKALIALRESEERYRHIVERSNEIIFTVSTEGKFLFLSPAFEKVVGIPPGEWLGKPFSNFVHPDDLPLVQERFVHALKGEELSLIEVRCLGKSGKHDLSIEYSSVPLMAEGKVTAILGVARDITERHKIEEDRRNLAVLRERELVSRWLHDHLGADLYNITLLVDDVRTKKPEPEVLNQQLDWISETSRMAMASMRNYLDFSSQVGASFGDLVGHMQKYGRYLLNSLGTEFVFDYRESSSPPSLAGLQSFSLYLIFKESLTNIVKHARAGKVLVTLAVENGQLNMSIEDDGKGFPTKGALPGSYGTANIKARAEEMGADLRITTLPREGTRVDLSIPL